MILVKNCFEYTIQSVSQSIHKCQTCSLQQTCSERADITRPAPSLFHYRCIVGPHPSSSHPFWNRLHISLKPSPWLPPHLKVTHLPDLEAGRGPKNQGQPLPFQPSLYRWENEATQKIREKWVSSLPNQCSFWHQRWPDSVSCFHSLLRVLGLSTSQGTVYFFVRPYDWDMHGFHFSCRETGET